MINPIYKIPDFEEQLKDIKTLTVLEAYEKLRKLYPHLPEKITVGSRIRESWRLSEVGYHLIDDAGDAVGSAWQHPEGWEFFTDNSVELIRESEDTQK